MTIAEEAEALRNISLFSRLDPVRLKLIAFASERQTYPKGVVFFNEGDAADAAYVVLSGKVEICLKLNGELTVISVAGEGRLVGESAILTNRSRSATVRACEDTVVLRLLKEDFIDLLEETPYVATEVTRILAERLNETTDILRKGIKKESI